MDLGTAVGYLDLDTSKFQSGLKTAQSQLKGFTDNTQKMDDRFKSLGTALKSVGSTLTKSVTLPLAAVGTGATKVAADFEKGMSQVAATMGMTAEEINGGSKAFEDLKAAAMDAGAKTQFSASESAEALNYLALAGYDTEKAIATLPTVLNLAAAGGLELGYASDVMTDAMSALGMSTSQAEVFVDQLAKTSQKSNTNVGQLGEAILTVGGTAKVLAGGTTELNTALGILADNGIKGAEGGTALRNIILALTPSTDKAVAAFKKLGVETYDANGNLKPINETFSEMESKLKNLSQEERTRVLSDIFNKVDLKSVNALLANSGERFDELSGYINNASGAASDMAETMNNNLSGQLTLLKSGLEGAGIAIGNALLPVIKQLVTGINNLVNWFNSLNPSMQTSIVVIGGIVAAIGPVLLIFGNLVVAVGNVITGFGLLKTGVVALGGILKSNLLASIISVNMKFTSIMATLTEFAGIIKGVVLTSIKSISTFLSGTLIPVLTTTAFTIGTITVPVWAVIAVFAALVAAGVLVYKNWDTIKAKCKEIWEGSIKPIIQNTTEFIKGILTTVWNGIKSFLTTCWNSLKQVASSAWNGIKSVIQTVSNAIKSVVSSIWNGIKTVITTVWNGIKIVVTAYINSLKSSIQTAFNVISSIIKTASNIWKSTVQSVWNGIKSITSSVLGGIKNIISSAFSGIASSISSSLSNAFNVAKGWWNKIKDIFSAPIKAIVNIAKNEKSLKFNPALDSYNNNLKVRENMINDFAAGINARTYTMYKDNKVDLEIPKIKTEKDNKEQPINISLNIDKFINETSQSIDDLMNEIAFIAKRKSILR